MPGELIHYPFTYVSLRDALLALGTTSHAVERNLLGMGVRGVRGDECRCALAAYLTEVIAGATKVYIYLDDNDSKVYARADRHVDGRLVGRIDALAGGPLPTFVRLFDRGDFPDLEVSDAA